MVRGGGESIRIDSEDLYLIAERLDYIKDLVITQLAEMNTYLTTEESSSPLTTDQIFVTHMKPQKETEVNPQDVNFDTILESIAVSQSISQEPSEYGYPEGSILYRTKEGLLTDTFEEEAQEITITSATSDNLSAGTAAWVNGSLILGTGVDSEDYYEQGYEEACSSKIIVEASHGDSYHVFERDAEDVYVFARNNSGAPMSLNGRSISFKESNVLAGEGGTGGRGSYMHHFGPVRKGDVVYTHAQTWIVY